MVKNPIDEAEALYRHRRWAQLIVLLEPLSAVYRDNARFSVLLGSAYLFKEDSGGAYSCFRRAQSLDYRNVSGSLGLAAVYIRRGETDKAVQLYIEILEKHPRDRIARLGLLYLRRSSGTDEKLKARKVRRLYPMPPPRWGIFALVLIASSALALGLFLYPALVGAVQQSRPRRDGVSDIVLSSEEVAIPVGGVGEFDIVLTEKEAIEAFEKAKRLFSDYRDEAALVELNRLMISNASSGVKNKAASLSRYVREPSFLSMPDRFGYADVATFPKLYEGVGIIWKGLPANIVESTTGAKDATSTSFDLLVGYHDKKRLEGIVQVVTRFQTRLIPDRPIEVLGRVRRVEGRAFYIECLAIHEQ